MELKLQVTAVMTGWIRCADPYSLVSKVLKKTTVKIIAMALKKLTA